MHWLALLRWIGPPVLFVALLLSPGPPYQDSTPELEAKYRAESARCEFVFVTGLAMTAIGFISRLFVKETPLSKPNLLDRLFDRFIAE